MNRPAFDVTIYHNPACGTSRNTLALIRTAAIEPRIVEYLKTPPDRGHAAGSRARPAAGERARDPAFAGEKP